MRENFDLIRVPAYMLETEELAGWHERLSKMAKMTPAAVELHDGIKDIEHVLRMRDMLDRVRRPS